MTGQWRLRAPHQTSPGKINTLEKQYLVVKVLCSGKDDKYHKTEYYSNYSILLLHRTPFADDANTAIITRLPCNYGISVYT